MQITRLGSLGLLPSPVSEAEVPVPRPGGGEVLVKVHVCGVCHTELDEIEGRTPPARLPMTPGHQVVGRVIEEGAGCTLGLLGKHVGIAWIHGACGTCRYCREGRENLCAGFQATGRDVDGGYAEFMTIDEKFAIPLPEGLNDAEAAPLLCAGAVGYRALKLCDLADGEVLGLTGFGASGHIVLQMAQHLNPASPVFVFARSPKEREFAQSIGADWAGDTREAPPRAVDAMIDTTPAWLPVVAGLEALSPGGRLIINAIRKEDGDHGELDRLDYDRHLWREKSIRSVANITREDVRGCLELASGGAIRVAAEVLPLKLANEALRKIRRGGLRGAYVLKVGE